MYNILIALGLSGLTYGVVAVALHAVAAVIPAVAVFGVAVFVLTRRTGRQVEEAMKPLQHLLQARKVDEAKALLRDVKQRFGRWQMLLDGQLEAQLLRLLASSDSLPGDLRVRLDAVSLEHIYQFRIWPVHSLTINMFYKTEFTARPCLLRVHRLVPLGEPAAIPVAARAAAATSVRVRVAARRSVRSTSSTG